MRHRKGFNHLGRTSSHRKAMLSNMATSLIMHKRISTTVSKAKALRSYVEPLVRKAQLANSDSVQQLPDEERKAKRMHLQRTAFSYLQNKHSVKELFAEVGLKVSDRQGGYTRILKTGNRLGDNAEMCIIELVDYNENMLEAKTAKKATRRTRRGKKTSTTEASAETTTEEPKSEE